MGQIHDLTLRIPDHLGRNFLRLMPQYHLFLENQFVMINEKKLFNLRVALTWFLFGFVFSLYYRFFYIVKLCSHGSLLIMKLCMYVASDFSRSRMYKKTVIFLQIIHYNRTSSKYPRKSKQRILIGTKIFKHSCLYIFNVFIS